MYNAQGFDTSQMMGGLGPMGDAQISGKWVNKRTGQVINVRDAIIEGDNMIIISDMGQIDMTEFSRDYIQQSDEVYEAPKVTQASASTLKDIINEDPTIISSGVNPLDVPLTQINNPISSVQQNKQNIGHYEMIDKIFVKNESKPKIKFEIEWANFPAKELQMLVDYFDVSVEDIAKYISNTFVEQQLIADSLTEFVSKQISE